MPGKRTKNVTNPQAAEAWRKRKRELNSRDIKGTIRQGDWRVVCLEERAMKGTLTEKNKAEMTRLGM